MDYDRIDSDVAGLWPVPGADKVPVALSRWLWGVSQRGIALFGCILLLPLFVLLYVAVRSTSHGPFLFTQLRRGYRDRPFRIYKIRTMVVNTRRPAALWMSRCDPEITLVGRLLRELKLDELPQLWNVVLGQMQFVGPRPIAMDLDDFLRQHVRGFGVRSSVAPGLTSLAQLMTRECRSEEDLLVHWRRRFELDLQCIQNKSFRYDLRVLGRTVLYLMGALAGPFVRRRGPREQSVQDTATLVLGTPIANSDYERVVNRIAEWTRRREHRYIAVCPVCSLVHAIWDKQHQHALWAASLNTADGVPVMWAQKLLGARRATRVAGPTLMLKILERAERDGWRVALYGGEANRLQKLVENVRLQHPKLEIADAISPPFRAISDEEDEQMIDRLNRSRPDVIFIGLGCPKQERWMLEHSPRIPGVMIGVGAAFDFHSGAVPRAPMFLQRLGLEWVHRLCCEPRRLFWRYATTNPVYIVLILRQLLSRIVMRRRYQVPIVWEVQPRAAVKVTVMETARKDFAKPEA